MHFRKSYLVALIVAGLGACSATGPAVQTAGTAGAEGARRGTGAVPDAVAVTPAGPAMPAARADFLKLIDRPRVALDPQVQEQTASAGQLQYHFTYGSDAADRVPGLLVKPAAATGKLPVVIYLHGTGGSKQDGLAMMRQLAAKGFIAVAIDGPFFGERKTRGSAKPYDDAVFQAWQDGKSHPFFFDTVWDVMRLIDYLQTRPDVDATRIGLYGVSKGGIETYLTAAVDPRVAVAVPCIAVESFQWADENNTWKARIETIQSGFDRAAKAANVAAPDGAFVAAFYKRVAPGIDGEFDGPSMVPLIAPRPLMTINGQRDPRTPPASLKLCTDPMTSAYKAAGAEDHLLVRIEANTAHRVNPDSQAAAIDWFVKWLKP